MPASSNSSNSSENMYIIKTVIASEAKQSIAQQEEKNGLLRRFAPRNDVDRAHARGSN
jgi:hypothetical protein